MRIVQFWWLLPSACFAFLLASSSGCGSSGKNADLVPENPEIVSGEKGLLGPPDFYAIPDEKERSKALFLEVSKVLKHPRCANCHPSDGQPRQGDKQAMHSPPIFGGEDGRGVAVLPCQSCHQTKNQEYSVVPGAPNWHLAPNSMVFIDTSPADICAHLKDPKANGGKTLEELIVHLAADPLVAWGYSPGSGREPAPGSPKLTAALFSSWIKTGAVCPEK